MPLNRKGIYKKLKLKEEVINNPNINKKSLKL